jgi:four helix bundle protein
MTEIQREKKYDLEERTLFFAKSVINLVNKLEKTIPNAEISSPLVRSSGSVGANYIEANEALSKKDFVFRIKICRKEAKESCYWLKLVTCNEARKSDQNRLIKEGSELMKIFGSILMKSQ